MHARITSRTSGYMNPSSPKEPAVSGDGDQAGISFFAARRVRSAHVSNAKRMRNDGSSSATCRN